MLMVKYLTNKQYTICLSFAVVWTFVVTIVLIWMQLDGWQYYLLFTPSWIFIGYQLFDLYKEGDKK